MQCFRKFTSGRQRFSLFSANLGKKVTYIDDYFDSLDIQKLFFALATDLE